MKRIVRNGVGLIVLLGALGAMAAGMSGWHSLVGPAVLTALAGLALATMSHAALRNYAFTAWVFVFVSASLFHPQAFMAWFGHDLKGLIVPLIQIIMFGMGTTLSVGDFARVARMPWPVFVGMVLQFSIMPFAGYLCATAFELQGEVAAGVVLVGACPGGVASNVMTYLARGNVPLSVTMTACSTLMAPVMTPLMMKLLAGRMIAVDAVEMVLAICDMIIVPIVAGLIANRILFSNRPGQRRPATLLLITIGSLAAAMLAVWNASWFSGLQSGFILGCVLISFVAITKLIQQAVFPSQDNWLEKILPLISMAGICLILAIIAARSSHSLATIGLPLVMACIVHNAIGYVLGYWGARLAGLDECDSRTVAIEVGLQNSGMASGLAMNMLNSPKAALAAAIFGPWMNTSGSILATWWRGRPMTTTIPDKGNEKMTNVEIRMSKE